MPSSIAFYKHRIKLTTLGHVQSSLFPCHQIRIYFALILHHLRIQSIIKSILAISNWLRKKKCGRPKAACCTVYTLLWPAFCGLLANIFVNLNVMLKILSSFRPRFCQKLVSSKTKKKTNEKKKIEVYIETISGTNKLMKNVTIFFDAHDQIA